MQFLVVERPPRGDLRDRDQLLVPDPAGRASFQVPGTDQGLQVLAGRGGEEDVVGLPEEAADDGRPRDVDRGDEEERHGGLPVEVAEKLFFVVDLRFKLF